MLTIYYNLFSLLTLRMCVYPLVFSDPSLICPFPSLPSLHLSLLHLCSLFIPSHSLYPSPLPPLSLPSSTTPYKPPSPSQSLSHSPPLPTLPLALYFSPTSLPYLLFAHSSISPSHFLLHPTQAYCKIDVRYLNTTNVVILGCQF